MTVIEAVAAHGLRSRHDLSAAPLDVDAARALVADAESQGVLGLLTAAVRAGALELPAETRASLEAMELGWLGHDLRLERLVLRARARLRAERIVSRVLEGVALAHTAYRDPAMRVFGDVDLLVPEDRGADATHALEQELGATRVQPALQAGVGERSGKETLRTPDGLWLEVHRVPVEGERDLTIDPADLFAPPYRFGLGGEDLEALPMPQRLLHACDAAAFGDSPPRLVALRDVAQLVIAERPNLVDVLLMARRWQREAVVARAVSLAWARLALTDRPPIVDWAERSQSSAGSQDVPVAREDPRS